MFLWLPCHLKPLTPIQQYKYAFPFFTWAYSIYFLFHGLNVQEYTVAQSQTSGHIWKGIVGIKEIFEGCFFDFISDSFCPPEFARLSVAAVYFCTPRLWFTHFNSWAPAVKKQIVFLRDFFSPPPRFLHFYPHTFHLLLRPAASLSHFHTLSCFFYLALLLSILILLISHPSAFCPLPLTFQFVWACLCIVWCCRSTQLTLLCPQLTLGAVS